jgi:hypothetical protein
MDSFTVWTLQRLGKKQGIKSRLSEISSLIDWVPIRRILDEMYHNKSEKGGRPNCDVIFDVQNFHTSTMVWFKDDGYYEIWGKNSGSRR